MYQSVINHPQLVSETRAITTGICGMGPMAADSVNATQDTFFVDVATWLDCSSIVEMLGSAAYQCHEGLNDILMSCFGS